MSRDPAAYVHLNSTCTSCGMSFHNCKLCHCESPDGRCPTCLWLEDVPQDSWPGLDR